MADKLDKADVSSPASLETQPLAPHDQQSRPDGTNNTDPLKTAALNEPSSVPDESNKA